MRNPPRETTVQVRCVMLSCLERKKNDYEAKSVVRESDKTERSSSIECIVEEEKNRDWTCCECCQFLFIQKVPRVATVVVNDLIARHCRSLERQRVLDMSQL